MTCEERATAGHLSPFGDSVKAWGVVWKIMCLRSYPLTSAPKRRDFPAKRHDCCRTPKTTTREQREPKLTKTCSQTVENYTLFAFVHTCNDYFGGNGRITTLSVCQDTFLKVPVPANTTGTSRETQVDFTTQHAKRDRRLEKSDRSHVFKG